PYLRLNRYFYYLLKRRYPLEKRYLRTVTVRYNY
ncbi:hypothetical protein MPH_10221, partial [Macrophomina phaseolina MS6]